MNSETTAKDRIHALLRRCGVMLVEDAIPLLSDIERDRLKAHLLEAGTSTAKVRALFELVEIFEATRRGERSGVSRVLLNEGWPAASVNRLFTPEVQA